MIQVPVKKNKNIRSKQFVQIPYSYEEELREEKRCRCPTFSEIYDRDTQANIQEEDLVEMIFAFDWSLLDALDSGVLSTKNRIEFAQEIQDIYQCGAELRVKVIKKT